MPLKKRYFGLIPQGPDPRDYAAPEPTERAIPPAEFEIKNLAPIFDQKSTNSCTANMMTAIYMYLRGRQGLPSRVFSRLFQYYMTRSLSGSTGSDSGATIRDTFKALNKFGAAYETSWPFVVAKVLSKPTPAVTAEAAKRKTIGYGAVDQTLEKVKTQIAAGNPIGFGFAVWSSFYNVSKNGVMPKPDYAKERIEGYHAVYAVGYSDSKRLVKCANSWGTGFGEKGFFYIPYDLFFDRSFAFDFWTAWLVPQVD